MSEYLFAIPTFGYLDQYGGVGINRAHNYEGIGNCSGIVELMDNRNSGIIYLEKSDQGQYESQGRGRDRRIGISTICYQKFYRRRKYLDGLFVGRFTERNLISQKNGHEKRYGSYKREVEWCYKERNERNEQNFKKRNGGTRFCGKCQALLVFSFCRKVPIHTTACCWK